MTPEDRKRIKMYLAGEQRHRCWDWTYFIKKIEVNLIPLADEALELLGLHIKDLETLCSKIDCNSNLYAWLQVSQTRLRKAVEMVTNTKEKGGEL